MFRQKKFKLCNILYSAAAIISLLQSENSFTTQAFSHLTNSRAQFHETGFVSSTECFNGGLFRTTRRSKWMSQPCHNVDYHSKQLRGQRSDEDDESSEDDWRDFRARLVKKYEQGSDESVGIDGRDDTSIGMNNWAYTVDGLIEKGTIIISRPEQDFNYGLRQQYFHKSVILVVYHEENIFTKGIILNRPCNLVLEGKDFEKEDGTPLSEEELEMKFKVWFGGEVQCIHSEDPEIICLHSLKGELADEVSETIIKGLKYTNLSGARKLVVEGQAEPSDFWVSCGYAGWESGQIQNEVDRNAWYLMATDSQTVLAELQRNSACKDPKDAGLDAWNHMMYMIGKNDEIDETSDDVSNFDDLMLREWAREKLIFDHSHNGGSSGGGETFQSSEELTFSSKLFEDLDNVGVGSIVRSRCKGKSPFLLNDQEYHKSVMLILREDEHMSIGVVLNLPTANEVYTVPSRPGTQDATVFDFVERYGGQYELEGDEGQGGLFWLHCNENLRNHNVGFPLGNQENKIWTSSHREAIQAIQNGLADTSDFVVVNGFSIFNKELKDGMVDGGIKGAILDGHFELVESTQIECMWQNLIQQQHMSLSTLENNLNLSLSAWKCSGTGDDYNDEDDFTSKIIEGEGSTTQLADNALRGWIATFLLGKPELRNK